MITRGTYPDLGDFYDALYRSDHGLPPEPGDAELIRAGDAYLTGVDLHRQAAEHDQWETDRYDRAATWSADGDTRRGQSGSVNYWITGAMG